MSESDVTQPEDRALLGAIARVWQQVDPAPTDLVDGVLAAIAAEDLEFELLTLVSSEGTLAGVRHAATEQREDPGAWMLEYEAPDLRIYLRLDRVEGRSRLDGWVVPARGLTVRLTAEDETASSAPVETSVDEFGRFEFPSAAPGLSRLTFLDESDADARPRITPPFWI